jgi:DNA polymerase V
MSDKEKENSSEVVDISLALTESNIELPLFRGISAGFPSPAMDFIDLSIDLNKQLIKHPSATYYGRVKGESMCDVGINDGDLLVIDKSIEPENGKIAVCFFDGDFTLKRIKIEKDGIWLMPANKNYKPIHCTENNELSIWGVVTYVIKSF